MSDTPKTVDELKAELEALQESDEVTGVERLEKTNELIGLIRTAQAEADAATAAAELLAEPEADATDELVADESTDEPTDEVVTEIADEATLVTADADTEDLTIETEESIVDDAQKAEALAAAQTVDKPQTTTNTPKISITAAMSGEGFSRGAEMTPNDWAQAHKLSVNNSRTGQKGRYIVASINREVGPAVSSQNGADHNAAIMASAEVTPNDSITAAACFCGPDEAVKEIRTVGTDARPVSDIFRKVAVNGRFNYTKDLGLADVEGGVSIWECADQEAADIDDSLTWKPCVSLDCGEEVTVEPYAIPVCGTYSIFQDLSHPQRVAAFISKLGVATARVAERKLLDRIYEESRVWTHTTTNGLFNTLINILGQIHSPLAYGERLGERDYVALLPVGLLEALTTDVILNGTRNYQNPSQYVLDAISALGVSRVVTILDVDAANESANYLPPSAALPALGTPTAWDQGASAVGTHKVYLLDPSDFVQGQTEVVSVGTIQDASLVKTNQVQTFTESLEFLEKTGAGESAVLELTACPSGVAAGNDDAGIPCEIIE